MAETSKNARLRGGALTAIALAVIVTPVAVRADDTTQWQKDRQTRFAAYQAAHPNPDAEIAFIKARTAAMIAAYVPPPVAPKYADLQARSAALTPQQKAQAVQMFVTAQGLWKSGDFDAAREGFSQGLAIDPANGPANFYMGDILQRQNNAAGAGLYMDRAVTLGPATAEAFKAAAALRNLPAPDSDSALDRPPVVWKVAEAPIELWEWAAYPEMIVVPAGEYTMGSPVTESGRRNADEMRHRVRIGHSFAASKYPVTVGEFAQFVAETRYEAGDQCYTYEEGWNERSGRNWKHPGFEQTNLSPAVCLNWNDAQAYVAWLSRKTGHAYRLLSDAEYEYANRAGTTTAYWWGNDIGKNRAHCDGCGIISDAKRTFSVGSFPPNSFYLYDTSGNVWSWVLNCSGNNCVDRLDNGSSVPATGCFTRFLRGGSWSSDPSDIRAASCTGWDPNERDSAWGFRVARTL